jgi:hypothetical protein
LHIKLVDYFHEDLIWSDDLDQEETKLEIARSVISSFEGGLPNFHHLHSKSNLAQIIPVFERCT